MRPPVQRIIQKKVCVSKVLKSSLGIGAAGQCISGFAHGVCRLQVRNHRYQFDVLDVSFDRIQARTSEQM
jgi:hypothetical protein